MLEGGSCRWPQEALCAVRVALSGTATEPEHRPALPARHFRHFHPFPSSRNSSTQGNKPSVPQEGRRTWVLLPGKRKTERAPQRPVWSREIRARGQLAVATGALPSWVLPGAVPGSRIPVCL